jgi:hypothetical protein
MAKRKGRSKSQKHKAGVHKEPVACTCPACVAYSDIEIALNVLEDEVYPGMDQGGEVAQRLLELLGRLSDIQVEGGSGFCEKKVKLLLN